MLLKLRVLLMILLCTLLRRMVSSVDHGALGDSEFDNLLHLHVSLLVVILELLSEIFELVI